MPLYRFWLLLLYLMVRHNLSQEQETDKATLEFTCPSGSDIVQMQFFQAPTEFEKSSTVCKTRKTAMLNINLYQHQTIKHCIDDKLERTHEAGVWVDSHLGVTLFFNRTNSYLANRDNDGHSIICVKQDVVFKTFNLTVQENGSSPIDIDLLPSFCETKRVFNVTKGQNVTLKCDATGMPAPSLKITQNGQSLNYSSSTTEYPIVTIAIDTIGCGDVMNITCKDETSSKSMSVSFIRHCEGSSTSEGDNYADKLPYTTIKVTQPSCDQTSPPSTHVAEVTTRCQTNGASNCGDSMTNDTTKISPTDIDSSKAPDSHDNNKLVPTAVAPEFDHLAVAIPVALATVAVVLAICCIICIAVGVLLYRKRGKVIRHLSNFSKINGNFPKKAASDQSHFELRHFINNGRAIVQEEQDLHSMANTVNEYTNVISALQANYSDEQKELFKETSFSHSEKIKDGTSTGYGHSNGRVSSLASTSGHDTMQSGRYLSDGLIYTTVESTGKGSIKKPVKKTEPIEHVDYVTLDFVKTNKLYLKKQKRLAGKKTRRV